MHPTLNIAVKAARRAGGIITRATHDIDKIKVSAKRDKDFVTEIDRAAEEAIIRVLREAYPDHAILAEESGSSGESDYLWIIDPLDGTTNYVHGFPYYAVSIGLEHQGEMIAGVIFDPVRDELFLASKGGGASLNRRPLRCSEIGSLDQSLVIASLPVGTEATDLAVKRFLTVLPHAQTVQRTGSAAMNLAYLAAGRLEGFWSSSLKPWDMAAGVLLVTEAGGKITRMDGGPFELRRADLLATNGSGVHAELCNLLSSK